MMATFPGDSGMSRCVLCWVQALLALPMRKEGLAYSCTFVCMMGVQKLIGRVQP